MSLRGTSKTRLDTLNDSVVNKTVMWLKPVNAKRRIELIKTGLYNVDVKYEYVQSKVYELTLYDNDNNPLVFETIYVFDENANTYFKFENQKVVKFEETADIILLKTEANSYSCDQLFNSILNPYEVENQRQYPLLKQHFIGWFIVSEQEIFNPDQATFMDFSVEQKGNTRFIEIQLNQYTKDRNKRKSLNACYSTF